MNQPNSLTLAIVGHLVGDYLLQNDWMALHKKDPGPDGFFRCWTHCALWTTSVCLFSGWFGWRDPLRHECLLFAVLFAAHFAQDRTNVITWWMKKIGQAQFATPPCAPWSIIVVDNVWHIVTLWAVWRFLA